jgi:prolipoprotein diacylglyceryltransferase
MNFFGFHPTQAEIIAVCLILVGIILWIVLAKKHNAHAVRA